MNLFFDKRYVRPSGRNDFPYAVPSPELSQTQLQAESYLLYQYLVRQDVCSASILPDSKKMLSTYASLAGTDPKNLEYLMMLLSGMIIKVKEPLEPEYPYFRAGLIVFTYLHFAASRQLLDAMLSAHVTGVAYETLIEKDGSLPLLKPM